MILDDQQDSPAVGFADRPVPDTGARRRWRTAWRVARIVLDTHDQMYGYPWDVDLSGLPLLDVALTALHRRRDGDPLDNAGRWISRLWWV